MSAQAIPATGAALFSKFSDVLRNDQHKLHPTVDFDWRGLESFTEEDREEIKLEVRRQLGVVLKRLAEFLVEDGQAKVEGAGIRAYVFAWSVLDRMQGLSQVQLANVLNKHKQSIGRVVSLFRDRFGWVGSRMQSEKARESCRKREARKLEAKFSEEKGFAVEIEKEQ